jgi:hypothetical protein
MIGPMSDLLPQIVNASTQTKDANTTLTNVEPPTIDWEMTNKREQFLMTNHSKVLHILHYIVEPWVRILGINIMILFILKQITVRKLHESKKSLVSSLLTCIWGNIETMDRIDMISMTTSPPLVLIMAHIDILYHLSLKRCPVRQQVQWDHCKGVLNLTKADIKVIYYIPHAYMLCSCLIYSMFVCQYFGCQFCPVTHCIWACFEVQPALFLPVCLQGCMFVDW